MTENLQADGVQSRQTLFVRYCLKETQFHVKKRSEQINQLALNAFCV